jgi:AraC family transcriptional regulator
VSLTGKVIWFVERNMQRELSLADISDACAVSPFQLSHAFSRMTGNPIMGYLRARRLSEAAIQLASGHRDILALALDSGYSSHEAFSRAFKSQFGETPETIRQRGTVEGLALTVPIHVAPPQELANMIPHIVQGKEMKAVGLSKLYLMGKVEGIANQWPAFLARLHQIDNQKPTCPLGICRITGRDNELEYLCAAEVTAVTRAPDGMVAIDIPPQRYAVFDHRAHISSIQSTYSAIWDRWLPAAGLEVVDAPSLEIYAPTFDPVTGNGGAGIWIPVA